jgi:hypothetical protein
MPYINFSQQQEQAFNQSGEEIQNCKMFLDELMPQTNIQATIVYGILNNASFPKLMCI